MSALGQKRTFAVQEGMSALPPKADIGWQRCQVRFVPIADIGFNSITSSPPASKWRLEGCESISGMLPKRCHRSVAWCAGASLPNIREIDVITPAQQNFDRHVSASGRAPLRRACRFPARSHRALRPPDPRRGSGAVRCLRPPWA